MSHCQKNRGSSSTPIDHLLPMTVMDLQDITVDHHDHKCTVCSGAYPLIACNRCKVVWYCSPQHARSDSAKHIRDCNPIEIMSHDQHIDFTPPETVVVDYAIGGSANWIRPLSSTHSGDTEKKEDKQTTRRRWFSFLLYYLTRIMICQRLYFMLYSWTPSHGAHELASAASLSPIPSSSFDANDLDVQDSMLSSDMKRWRRNLRSMLHVWAYIAGGSALVLPTAVALMQIPSVFNHLYLRIAVILAFLLSLSSGASACIFCAFGELLGSSTKGSRWVEASRYKKSTSSVDFWACLAWPLTSLSWAILLCLSTVFALAWMDPPSSDDLGPSLHGVSKIHIVIISCVTLTVATVAFGLSIRVYKFVWG